jgi:BMFP domain-containing protein YqiC
MGQNEFELSFQVLLREKEKHANLVTELSNLESIEHVRLYHDEDQN